MAEEIGAEVPDLPPLIGGDLALVKRHPLPAGVADAVVNKKLLAHALDVSATTVDAWLVDGLPYVEKGTNGRSYSFRLSVCFAWARERTATAARSEAQAQDAAAQLRLQLLGGSVADESRAGLSPKEHREALEVEMAAMKAAQMRRDLVRADEVATGFEAAFVVIRDGFDAAPDALALELGLTPAQTERVQIILDEILRKAQSKVAAVIDGD